MGWASGSELATKIINSIKKNVESELDRSALYYDLIDAFEDQDCDTLDDCIDIDPVFDEVYYDAMNECEELTYDEEDLRELNFDDDYDDEED